MTSAAAATPPAPEPPPGSASGVPGFGVMRASAMDAVAALADLPADLASRVTAAWDRISEDRLRELAVLLVDAPSPTGEEMPAAEAAVHALRSAGVPAGLQHLDDRQANATGRLAGTGDGPDLLLYAPLDTLTTGRAEEDLPWLGPTLRPDMLPSATVDGPFVTGLGAGNPKGHAACVLAAAEVLAAADVPLRGDVVVGLGAGGMPSNARDLPGRTRRGTGHGVGASFLLEQGGYADFAVIAKPGWTVSWEEVGLAWFELTVHGTHTYVGSRHRLPYRNAIDDAGEVVRFLEAWFPEYAERHADGLVAPQGIVAAIEGGWWRTASVTPAACRLLVDLRLSPRTTPADARRELAAALDRLRATHPELEVDCRPVLTIPGTTTDPDSAVVRSTIAAWEGLEGRTHEVVTGTSGATDANILRSRGLPTARIGMPKVSRPGMDFALGMNTVDVRDMATLTRLLVRVAVDLCGRTTAETGGSGR